MPPISDQVTPNGMQSPYDASYLTWQYGYPQGWETNNGGSRLQPAGFVDKSYDPIGFRTWRDARAVLNSTSTPH